MTNFNVSRNAITIVEINSTKNVKNSAQCCRVYYICDIII